MSSKTTNATDLLSHGRRYLLSRAPYLYRLVSRTTMVPDERVGTLGVSDRMVLVYNPRYLEGKTHKEVGALLLHEMMHLAHTVIQAHDLPGVPHQTMNAAADLHINSLARDDGWELPPDGLFPEKFGFPEFLTTLEYLALLQKNPPSPESPPSGEDRNGGKGEQREEGKEGNERPSNDEGQEPEQQGEGGGIGGGGGSGEGEEGSNGKQPHSQPTSSGCCRGDCELKGALKEEMESRYGKGRSDLRTTVAQVAQALEEHQKRFGNTSLGAKLFGDFGKVRESDTDWRSVLRSWVLGYLGVGDNRTLPSYAKPHRRSFLGGDILIPGAYAECPDMVIVVDTSGSMDARLLSLCLSEIAGILSDLQLQEVELICADTRICSRRHVLFEDLYEPIDLAGGGGTDFATPIRQVAYSGGCGVMVYLTDGYGTFPTKTPPFPVVWACFTDAKFPPRQAVVRVKGE